MAFQEEKSVGLRDCIRLAEMVSRPVCLDKLSYGNKGRTMRETEGKFYGCKITKYDYTDRGNKIFYAILGTVKEFVAF